MGKTAWSVVCIVAAAVMAGITGVSAALGGCPTMLELASGNMVPMKCHWTFVACTFIGIIGVATGLAGLLCKEKTGRRAIALSYIVCAAIIACMPTSFAIGLCADATMHCHGTAHIVWALAAVAVVVGVVQLVKADPDKVKLPKQQL